MTYGLNVYKLDELFVRVILIGPKMDDKSFKNTVMFVYYHNYYCA